MVDVVRPSAPAQAGELLLILQVANHLGSGDTADFMLSGQYGPFSSDEDFHPFCLPTDWNNQREIEQCTCPSADLLTRPKRQLTLQVGSVRRCRT